LDGADQHRKNTENDADWMGEGSPVVSEGVPFSFLPFAVKGDPFAFESAAVRVLIP